VSAQPVKSKQPGSRALHQQSSITIRTDGGLRLVIVADTHGHPHAKGPSLIAAQNPDAILHAGDIGTLAVLEELRTIAPTLVVRGNIDERRSDLPDVLALKLMAADGNTGGSSLDLLLLHIGVYGVRLQAEAGRLARQYGSKIVICGHSHVPFIGRDKGVTIFNPGSIGPRRFDLPIVFGVFELVAGRVQLWHVDCETGEPWMPP
jgi:uncharacterized protein